MSISKHNHDTLFRTAFFVLLRRWIWPCIFTSLVTLAGGFSYHAVRLSARSNVESKLTTILETEIKALTIWTKEQQRSTAYFADRDDVRTAVIGLLKRRLEGNAGNAETGRSASQSESHVRLATLCGTTMRSFSYVDFRVLDLEGRVLASADERQLGRTVGGSWTDYLSVLAAGQMVFAPPALEHFSVPESADGADRADRPLLLVAAPIRDFREQVVAVIAFGIPPEGEFTRILSVARAGDSGETYAFNAEGWLLSDSRFAHQLIDSGRLPAGETNIPASPVLHFRLQPPGQSELTHAVASALAAHANGNNSIGLLVTGYRDYRGVLSVGAYQWLPQYDFGVITRINYHEAYAPGLLLRNLLAGLFGIALTAAAVNIFNTVRLARFQARVAHAEREARKLGQYTLQEKIGEGGMGEVYRATHAMLRRPTAVKLLRPERSSEAAVMRFEREVQMTALLTHPNTIAIYDYGRTSDGTFYYAMEYLDGVDLNRIVKKDGPQPEARVIGVLRQVCNSLTEAHEAGLVHRDIKPANVFLFRRGKRPDIVKVLDFGLVRHDEHPSRFDREETLAGTPAFMAPESFRIPSANDARSDIYAVGALGYFLLTGQNVFDSKDISSLAHKHATEQPVHPTTRLGQNLDAQLCELLMQCLRKTPEERPQTTAELSRALTSCDIAPNWTREQANQWWDNYHLFGLSQNSRSDTSEPQETTIEPDATVTYIQ